MNPSAFSSRISLFSRLKTGRDFIAGTLPVAILTKTWNSIFAKEGSMKLRTKAFQAVKTATARAFHVIKQAIKNFAKIAGIISLTWQIIWQLLIAFSGGLKVEFSHYWIYSRKVEHVEGTEECAVFDTITLPLTFYNTGGRAQTVRMLRLEVWTNGKFCGLFQAEREYEVFDQEEIENWRVKNFYINSVVPGHSSIVKVVEFYPTFWWESDKKKKILSCNLEPNIH